MTWNLTLDILLVVLVLLFAPIGYMRGPVKELLVTLGVVFGALTVEFWARPWGRDLDYYFDIGDDPGAFVVAMAFLMGTTFIGGYGLGLLLAPWTYSTRGRAAGAVTAILNGALLVSFSLQYVRLFLLSDANEDALEESYSVGFLMNEIGWVMLAALILLPVVIVYALVTRRRAYDLTIWDDYDEEYYDDYDAAYDYLDDERLGAETAGAFAPATASTSHMAETRVMPPRVPGGAHSEGVEYKSEPEPIPFRPAEATRPITVSDFEQEPAQGRGGASDPTQAEWFAIGDTDPSLEHADTTDLAPIPPPDDDAERQDEQAPEERLPEGYTRCEACHAVLPPNVHICPVCGHAH